MTRGWGVGGWLTALGLLACLLAQERALQEMEERFLVRAERIAREEIDRNLPRLVQEAMRTELQGVRDFAENLVTTTLRECLPDTSNTP